MCNDPHTPKNLSIAYDDLREFFNTLGTRVRRENDGESWVCWAVFRDLSIVDYEELEQFCDENKGWWRGPGHPFQGGFFIARNQHGRTLIKSRGGLDI